MTTASRHADQATRIDARKVTELESKSKQPGERIENIPTVRASNDHEGSVALTGDIV